MKHKLMLLIIMLLKYAMVFSQNVDFTRLGNEIHPLLGRNYLVQSNYEILKNNSILGVFGQESQWLGLKSRQSLDLVLFFTDKKQYTSILYSSPSLKQKEIALNYQRLLHQNLIVGSEIKYKIQSFPEYKKSYILTVGFQGIAKIHESHHLYIKFARDIYSTPLDKMEYILIGIDNKIGKFNHINIFYTYQGHQLFNGIRGNICSSFKLFEGDIGWEPLPYSFTIGLAYNLPKSIKFGLRVRQHQWLGILTTVFFQKHWNYKEK